MKIGLLDVYNYAGAKTGYMTEYAPMFLAFLREVLPDVEIMVYDVPSLDRLPAIDSCDAWLIGGSGKSAYDKDAWISRLEEWIRQAHAQQVKLVGVCFGHQLVAQALGGKVQKSPKGWELGIHEFTINKRLCWMNEAPPRVKLIFSHQDEVVELPPQAIHLAANDFCKNQMYAVGESVFCMQGHPEFSKGFMRDRLEAQHYDIDETTLDAAIDSLCQDTDHLRVGQWLNKFLDQ